MQNNQEVPTMFIELVNQQDSGFTRDDTKGTPYEETIKTAGVLFIPNRGKMAEEIIETYCCSPAGQTRVGLKEPAGIGISREGPDRCE